jgi:hypothetical protein
VLADRSYLRLIIAFPFLLGLIPRVIPAKGLDAFDGKPNPGATKVLVVLVLCACFMGMANSVREIVKERPIYRRERTIGLSRTAYLGSKVIVLTGITTLQCVVFTLIGLLGRTPKEAVLLGSPLLECLVAVIVAALASDDDRSSGLDAGRQRRQDDADSRSRDHGAAGVVRTA